MYFVCPLQLDLSKLSPEERWRLVPKLCFLNDYERYLTIFNLFTYDLHTPGFALMLSEYMHVI